MRNISVQLGGKTRDYIKTIPTSSKHAAEKRLGALDYVIILCLLLCAGVLAYLVLH